jgi:peptide-methionine (S)-S-oxide reductase
VGYAGGEKPHPTYHDLGDHAEAIEIGYDPSKISYELLLTEFFSAHTPTSEPWSTQYRSAIFVTSPEQRHAAELARRAAEKRLGKPVFTAIEDAGTFWVAEDYHQKYSLRSRRKQWEVLVGAYPDMDALLHSTAAARLGAWAGGYLDDASIQPVLRALSEPVPPG